MTFHLFRDLLSGHDRPLKSSSVKRRDKDNLIVRLQLVLIFTLEFPVCVVD